jgi:hypothetical protein
VRGHRRQPYLQALDASAARSEAARREADGDAAPVLLTAGVVHEYPSSPRSMKIVTAGYGTT